MPKWCQAPVSNEGAAFSGGAFFAAFFFAAPAAGGFGARHRFRAKARLFLAAPFFAAPAAGARLEKGAGSGDGAAHWCQAPVSNESTANGARRRFRAKARRFLAAPAAGAAGSAIYPTRRLAALGAVLDSDTVHAEEDTRSARRFDRW